VATALGGNVGGTPIATSLGTIPFGPAGLNATISSCEWVNASGANSIMISLYAFPGQGQNTAGIRQAFEQFLCLQRERVSSLGDVACWTDSNRTEIQFLKGTTFVQVETNAVGSASVSQGLQTLAGRAASRLP
jgi:hypothetical protein